MPAVTPDDLASTPITDLDEVAHYNAVNSGAEIELLREKVAAAVRAVSTRRVTADYWLDTRFDSVAQHESVSHVLPVVQGGHVVQLGGTGLIGLKALAFGAAKVTHVSPSQGELDLTKAVADEFDMGDRLVSVNGYAEDLALGDESVDAVISEASMHHTSFVQAMAEVHRVLKPGGRFGCFEPWKAPLYEFGTGLLGKRDPAVNCRPLDASRATGVSDVFPGAWVTWHGALSRYPLIALGKLGLPVSRRVSHVVTRADDFVLQLFPSLRRRWGSSVSVRGTK